jgi:Tol biopolymer transport system component
LSDTNGRVLEFSVDRSGDWIAFTVQNQAGGQDVWVMDRRGEEQRILVDCGQESCGEPAWSMDRETVAYTRQDSEAAQVWTVDVESGETTHLFPRKPAYGFSPAYSPDGRKLAFYDTVAQAIRIIDLQTADEATVLRGKSDSGDWSFDGSQIIFTDHVAAHHEPFVEAYVYNLGTQTVSLAFGKAIQDTEFSQPRWHPNGNWVAVSLRPVNAAISKALWVLPLVERDPILIDGDQSATFSAYQWDPWGDSLLYQRYNLAGSEPRASIWRWDWKPRQRIMVIENGARPQWLP